MSHALSTYGLSSGISTYLFYARSKRTLGWIEQDCCSQYLRWHIRLTKSNKINSRELFHFDWLGFLETLQIIHQDCDWLGTCYLYQNRFIDIPSGQFFLKVISKDYDLIWYAWNAKVFTFVEYLHTYYSKTPLTRTLIDHFTLWHKVYFQSLCIFLDLFMEQTNLIVWYRHCFHGTREPWFT